jgi:hypothetical protein
MQIQMQMNAESTRISIDTFYEGLEVEYYIPHINVKMFGVVNFVSDTYITILVRQGNHRSKDVNIVVPPNYWSNVSPINSKRQQ